MGDGVLEWERGDDDERKWDVGDGRDLSLESSFRAAPVFLGVGGGERGEFTPEPAAPTDILQKMNGFQKLMPL